MWRSQEKMLGEYEKVIRDSLIIHLHTSHCEGNLPRRDLKQGPASRTYHGTKYVKEELFIYSSSYSI